MSTKPIQFTVSPAEYEQLCDLARERGCSIGDLAREAVRVMYLEPRRLQSRLDALNDLLAPLEALAEDDEATDRLQKALETPSELTVPANLSRLLAGLESGSMFAGLGEIMDDLDELRAQLEADLEQAGEGDVP